MDVRHGLSRFFPEIDHQAVPFFRTVFLSNNFTYGRKELPEEAVVRRADFMDAGKVFARQRKQVEGRLRVDIFDYDHIVVFVNAMRRDLITDDFAENTVAHAPSFSPVCSVVDGF
jgi:hypothetical protein